MMTRLTLRRFAGLGFVVLCACMLGHGRPVQASDDVLAQTLARLDDASKKFSTAQADFEWDFYQKIINDTDKQFGTVWFKHVQGSTDMRTDVSDQMGARPSQMIVYTQGKLQIYEPRTDFLRVFTAGKNRTQYESFLTLGFGGSGSDLEKNWKIEYQGSESMKDGARSVSVVKLDLKPIQPAVAKMFTHVTIWVDPERGLSLRQQFFAPSGDVRTAIYSNIRYAAPVAASVFNLPLTKKTKVDSQ